MTLVALLAGWLGAGYAAWHIQARRILAWRKLEALDCFMIGPCLMAGPFMLLVLWRDARKR